jgi:hypothetical protein
MSLAAVAVEAVADEAAVEAHVAAAAAARE